MNATNASMPAALASVSGSEALIPNTIFSSSVPAASAASRRRRCRRAPGSCPQSRPAARRRTCARRARCESRSPGCGPGRCRRARCRCRPTPARAPPREHAEQQGAEPLRRQRLIAHLHHGSDVFDRLLWIERADRPVAVLRQRHRRHGGPHDEGEAAPVALACVAGTPSAARPRPAVLLDVADDADHCLDDVFDSSGSVTRRPIGSASPHSSFAAARLTSIASTSPSATSRPRSSGMLIVLQIPGRDLAHLRRSADRGAAARRWPSSDDWLHRPARRAADRRSPPAASRRAARAADAARCRRTRDALRRRRVSGLRAAPRSASARSCGSKPASTLRSASRLRSITAGAHQQHHRERDFADDQQPPRANADGARRCVRLPSAHRSDRSGRREAPAARRPASRSASDAPSTNSEHAAVDGDLLGPRHLARQQRRRRRARRRGRAADRAAPPAIASTSASISSCWNTRRAPGPERRADRDLLAPAERAREQQVADVGAGDQQHQRRPRPAASPATSGCRRRSAPAAAPPWRPSRRCPADIPARAGWR